MPNPNEETKPTIDTPAAVDAPPQEEHIEPAEAMLQPADEGALAAVTAALAGEPPPEVPASDEAPEGAASTATDETPKQPEEAKPEEAKPEAPVADKTDEPTKRPSDEFGELDKDVPARTRERFDAMKTSYDKLSEERDSAVEQANKWVETVQSTGATPDQFGMTLEYLQHVNSGTPEGLSKAFDMMLGELTVLANALGREVPGIVDPLAAHPDLLKRVEDEDIDRAGALELAQARATNKLAKVSNDVRAETNARKSSTDAGLQAVTEFGARMRASDPAYAQKAAAITPIIERVIGNLPPSQWVAAIEDAYKAVSHIQPAAAPAPDPVVTAPKPLRPTSTPGAGDVVKQPGSALEAVNAALASL